jgi:hypothetical protein
MVASPGAQLNPGHLSRLDPSINSRHTSQCSTALGVNGLEEGSLVWLGCSWALRTTAQLLGQVRIRPQYYGPNTTNLVVVDICQGVHGNAHSHGP